MKRKMAILTVLGALLALAVPASSSAYMAPAGHQFKFLTTGVPPKLGTSLGACPVTKIEGQVPFSPGNESAFNEVPVTMTFGSCPSGMSATLTGVKKMQVSGYRVTFFIEQVTLKYSSLPGCMLQGPAYARGLWLNGGNKEWWAAAGYQTKPSAYYAIASSPMTWKEDGAVCALTGKSETVTWSTGENYTLIENVTSASNPIWVG